MNYNLLQPLDATLRAARWDEFANQPIRYSPREAALAQSIHKRLFGYTLVAVPHQPRRRRYFRLGEQEVDK